MVAYLPIPHPSECLDRELWISGAQSRLRGDSVSQAYKSIYRYDHDARALVRSGWTAMEQFLVLDNLAQRRR